MRKIVAACLLALTVLSIAAESADAAGRRRGRGRAVLIIRGR